MSDKTGARGCFAPMVVCRKGQQPSRKAVEGNGRERSDRVVDGGSGWKESNPWLIRQLGERTNHGSSWESDLEADVYCSGRSVNSGPAGRQHQCGIDNERHQCGPGEQQTDTVAHRGNDERERSGQWQ